MRPDDGWLTISNEFTTIKVRKMLTRYGERLEIASIASPKLGNVIHLDPLELESLTWQDASTFSRLLETPQDSHLRTTQRPIASPMLDSLDLRKTEAWPQSSRHTVLRLS
jgi:hypothetical protein